MNGYNPDGSYYDDPGVPDVAYFNGKDAVQGFFRYSDGFRQSLSCVELPYSAAAIGFNCDPIGTSVTVSWRRSISRRDREIVRARRSSAGIHSGRRTCRKLSRRIRSVPSTAGPRAGGIGLDAFATSGASCRVTFSRAPGVAARRRA